MRRVVPLTTLLFCLPACGGDDMDLVDTGVETAPTGNGDGDGDGDTGEPFVPVPARGVTLTGVAANHGINVYIAREGEWVGPTGGREGRLASGRDTLIRVYHTLDPDWVEREIEARLEITMVGGEVREFSAKKTLVTDTSDNYLEGGLWFALPEAEGFTDPATKFQVSLWEVGPGGEALEEHNTLAPTSGPELIGFENIPMEMNVVFVPFTFNGKTPLVEDEAKMEIITKEIYQTEPIQTINSAVAPTLSSGGNFDVCAMLPTMNQIWSQAGSPSNVFYVGLVDTGASSGTLGCAWLGSNVSAALWINDNMGRTATSIVHEIGHDQGLNHVQCDDMGNPAAGPDTSYPDHPLGRTLNTGFGIRDFKMYPGDTTIDYMSYCNKRWVSPWTWNKVWSHIQNFTAQGSPLVADPDVVTDIAPGVAADIEPVLQFAMNADGSQSWWTATARLDPTRPPDAAYIEFLLDGEVIATEGAQVDLLSDDVTTWATVRMPNGDPEAEFDTVRYVGFDNSVSEARRDEVSFYTQLDLDVALPQLP